MARAPSHRGLRAPRFKSKSSLRAATIEKCEQEFAATFGKPWTQALARRYALDWQTKDNDDEAGKLLLRLQQLVGEIKTFHANTTVQSAVRGGEAPLRTKLLFDWAERRAKLLERFPMWDEAALAEPLATPRQWLARRVKRGGPQFFDRLEPRRPLKPRDGAVISLLAGNFPNLEPQRLKSSGFTVAEIIDLETKYMRKTRTGAKPNQG